MELVFVNIPRTGADLFEKNFNLKTANIDSNKHFIRSVGHSWIYPTQIKGWLDWDFPNQEWGIYRDVALYSITPSDRIITIIRNPFDLFFSYFRNDWAWCRTYHNLPTDSYTKEDFQKFVDIYLDESIEFHAPEFKKSLFSQLKDKSGRWILKRNSVVIRYENLLGDMQIFSRMTNLPIIDYSDLTKTKESTNSFEWWEAYREDQIHKLNELWQEDLEYFGYSFNDNSAGIYIENKSVYKPKIALCFSGFIRDIEHTKQFWTSLIDKYDIDVYGSFWDDENKNNNDTISNLKRIYDFKSLEFEKYSNFKKSTLDTISPYLYPTERILPELREYAKNFHTMSMWYKIWKSNMLSKDLDIKYDIVIRARTDTYFNDDLDITKNDYLNIPSGRVKTNGFDYSDGICDVFAYSKSQIMDYYSSTYLNLLEYVNQGHYMIPPENLLRVHMSKVDIDIRFFTNKLIITRYSKATPNEIYDKRTGVVEEILPSNFIDVSPNKDIQWTVPIRENLKF